MAKRVDVRMKDTNELPFILTIDEAAKFARIGKDSIYRAAQQGLFPVRKIGMQYRIPRDSFLQWLQEA